jgi:Tol biopolymer transport system component
MNADRADPERLIGSAADDWWPAWSPDGTRIAYASVPSPTRPGHLFVVVADGADPVRMDLPFAATYPAWSPSARIAFQDEAGDIWTVQPDGSGLNQVTDSPATEFAPAWSPNGTMLAFPSERWVEAG